jgi:uncharacterized protein Smg (DUF494 family)
MPTLKDHIAVVKAEIDATGKRLETETLAADQLIEIGNRMAQLGEALSWLMAIAEIKQPQKPTLVVAGSKWKDRLAEEVAKRNIH